MSIGKIDEIRVYDRLLSEAEITELYDFVNSTDQRLPESAISVYPNPSQGEFLVESTQLPLTHVTVMDLLGRKLESDIQLEGTKASVRTNFQGIALVRIETEEGYLVRKLSME